MSQHAGVASALLIPEEMPPHVLAVKQALLSFDTVHISSPDDRDVIPRSAFIAVLAGPLAGLLPLGIDAEPVIPLGKVDGYDSEFELLSKTLAPAFKQGSVVLEPSIQPTAPTGGLVLGNPPEWRGVPNPAWVYWVARVLSRNPKVLTSALSGLGDLSEFHQDDLAALATTGAGYGAIYNDPVLADVRLATPREVAKRLAIARVASVVRYVATADFKNLVPFTTDAGYKAVLGHCRTAAADIIRGETESTDESSSLRRLLRLHEVFVQDYLDLDALHEMSVRDVLTLRTKAWGKACEAREALLSDLDQFGVSESDDEFSRRCQDDFEAYFQARSDYEHETKKLRIGVRTILGSSAIPLAGEVILHGLNGITGAALIGLAAAAVNLRGLGAQSRMDIYRSQRVLRRVPGFTLAHPYAAFPVKPYLLKR